ncbi:response regulator [Aquitalea magnusonii]|uniref:Response regulator receiver domain-containing protein n=1 Tax=Aquitalea magnusonii TaxID=332411 RepID=A0A318JN30_9NEIS|nr:response regulator [Aquitalea magnusonii]PXX50136.1 response regulator receiver domain-containing protein [Aquitalea magnusonii]
MSNELEKLKILVVDDQSLVRTLVSQSLQSMGIRAENISQAPDGSTAMRTLDMRMVDLVLCDVEMKPMNGLDLLKELRCGHTMNASNLPFIILSGHADRGNVTVAMQLHADGFVVKPPKPVDVEKAIMQALRRTRPEVDPFSYYGVDTGTDYDKKVFRRLFEPRPEDLPDAPNETVTVNSAKPGAVLAEDLFSKSGHLLLPRGASISANQLAVLRNYSDRYGVQQLVVEKAVVVASDGDPASEPTG